MPRVVCKTSLQLLFAQLVEHALHADDCKKQDTLKSQNNIDPQDNESAFYRIERVGFDVGQRYIQRLIFDIGQENNTKSKHCIFPEAMDIVKFLCKEFWISLFGKSIDNLKTNHRGVFVLQDSVFSWISPFITLDTTAPEVAQMAVLYLAFPCGILRGALSAMGIPSTITAEIPTFPQCIFQIRTLKPVAAT